MFEATIPSIPLVSVILQHCESQDVAHAPLPAHHSPDGVLEDVGDEFRGPDDLVADLVDEGDGGGERPGQVVRPEGILCRTRVECHLRRPGMS